MPQRHLHADQHRGLVPTDQLGSGDADDTVFLRGDQTWAAPDGGGSGDQIISDDSTTAVTANDGNVDIYVGEHSIGFLIEEDDSTTVKIRGDGISGYDFEFTDTFSGKHWRMVALDGGVAIPSMGMLPQYASAPSSPVEGQSYYDTTDHTSRTWDGSAWQDWW